MSELRITRITRILRAFSVHSCLSAAVWIPLNFLVKLRIIGVTRRKKNDYTYTNEKL